MSIPTTQKAVVIRLGKGAVEDVAVPKIGSEDVLVKTVSVAVNPTDWKHARWGLAPDGTFLGCDFAGNVAAIGDNVKNFTVGESVYGFIPGGNEFDAGNGAYSEYVRIKARFLFKNKLEKTKSDDLPVGPITTYEGASSLIIPVITVGLAIDYTWKIPFFGASNPDNKSKVFFIWGGSTALGYIAIQSASRLGFKVIATASKKHAETLKKLGASAVFDYRDADVVDQIKKYAGDDIVYALDCISETSTTEEILKVVSTTKPVKIALVLPVELKSEKPSNVTTEMVLAYLAVADKKKFGELYISPPGMMDWGEKFVADFSKAVAKDPSFILHQPVKVSRGGLPDIEPGFEVLIKGQNSGYKVVIDL